MIDLPNTIRVELGPAIRIARQTDGSVFATIAHKKPGIILRSANLRRPQRGALAVPDSFFFYARTCQTRRQRANLHTLHFGHFAVAEPFKSTPQHNALRWSSTSVKARVRCRAHVGLLTSNIEKKGAAPVASTERGPRPLQIGRGSVATAPDQE